LPLINLPAAQPRPLAAAAIDLASPAMEVVLKETDARSWFARAVSEWEGSWG